MENRSWLQRITYNITQWVVRGVGWLLFGLRFEGNEQVPTTGGALVCSNHQSFLDPVLVGAITQRRINYLARQNLFDSRWFGGLIRWYDAIPVQRDGMSIGGLKETLRRLKRGELVLVFPEGTRTSNGEVAPLRAGFCVLARRAAVPLVSVGIEGAFHAWPRNQKLPRPTRICVKIGMPITAEQVRELSDEDLVALLDERIRACHDAARRMRG